MKIFERLNNLYRGVKQMSEQQITAPKAAALPRGIPNFGDVILQPGAAIKAQQAGARIILPVPAPFIAETPVITEPAAAPEPDADVKPAQVSQIPQCSTHDETMVLAFYDRPGGLQGNCWVCPSCAEERKLATQPPQQEPEVAPAPNMVLDTDYSNVAIPPRSPEMVAALIASGETPAERAMRINNDTARFRYRRGL